MLFLIIAVLSSFSLTLCFKLFGKYEIDTFQAIVYNYIVCVLTGSAVLGYFPIDASTVEQSWFTWASVLGFLFITGFYSAGMTVFHFGMAVGAVMQRMALVISVPFGIIMFSEASGPLKIMGIVLALLSVLLINIPSKKEEETAKVLDTVAENQGIEKWHYVFPISIFLFSGAIECILQYVQAPQMGYIKGDAETAAFSVSLFGIAGFLGSIALIIGLIMGKMRFEWKNVVAGIALGIPNYFSIYFLLKSFDQIDKTVALPINNISVVALAALLGYFAFSEKMSTLNKVGVLLAMLAIAFIALP